MEQYQTFIVRLSAETAGDEVRGRIEHVRTRRTAYFSDAAEMLGFIDGRLARYGAKPGKAEADSDGAGCSDSGARQGT